MNIELGDKIDIFCPLVDTFEETLNSENPLFLTLWAVDKDGYDNCSINGNTSKRIIRCTVPNYEKKFTIKATVSLLHKVEFRKLDRIRVYRPVNVHLLK